jgi:hypothetical protein
LTRFLAACACPADAAMTITAVAMHFNEALFTFVFLRTRHHNLAREHCKQLSRGETPEIRIGKNL